MMHSFILFFIFVKAIVKKQPQKNSIKVLLLSGQVMKLIYFQHNVLNQIEIIL